MLEAREVTVSYDHRIAVADLTLTLKPGEITAIIGPNGAGKSTLLRTLNGQIRQTSGAIVLDGQPLERLNRRSISRRVAVVGGDHSLRQHRHLVHGPPAEVDDLFGVSERPRRAAAIDE